MATLFDKSDSILTEVKPEWLAAVDVDHISRRISPWLKRREGTAKIIVAEALRIAWNKALPAMPARVLNDDRVQAVAQRLDDEFSPRELAYAILAYGQECREEPWRVEKASRCRSLESFLKHDRLEGYIQSGRVQAEKERSAKARRSERRQQHVQTYTASGLMSAFQAKPPAEQARLLNAAIADLEAKGTFAGARSPGNPLVRSKLLQLVQAELQDQAARPASAGQAVSAALG